jgi:hypothetical protein
MARTMTPEVELATTFELDARGRIRSTREPHASHGPLFAIIRSATGCAWAVRDDVPNDVADEMGHLTRDEPRMGDLRTEPLHAARYLSLTGGRPSFSGPAFIFPDVLETSSETVVVDDERLLRHFRGWQRGEIVAGRAPVMGLVEEGYPVSICFCARRSDTAAAAGLETAAPFRGRGFAARVVAAWALAVRATGRTPLYSTAWTNVASQAVARKLGLMPYATFWNISE